MSSAKEHSEKSSELADDATHFLGNGDEGAAHLAAQASQAHGLAALSLCAVTTLEKKWGSGAVS